MFRDVKRRGVVAIAVLAMLLGVPSVWAAGSDGMVRGVVKASSGQPMSGAFVKLYNPQLQLTMMVISQAGGRYVAENLPAGKYTVQGVGNGYQSTDVPVEVVSGKTATADVSLSEPQSPTTPNSWPLRHGKIGGNEEWMNEPAVTLVPGAGKQIIEAKCEQCHRTTRMVLLPQTRAKWAMTVATMRRYITELHLRQLTDQEAKTVADYLGEHYNGLPGSANAWPPLNSRLPRTVMDGAQTKYFAVDVKLPENPNRDPHDVTVDSKGNAWMPDRLGCCLVSFNPNTYKVTTYTLPKAAHPPIVGTPIGRNPSATVVWIQDPGNRRWLSFDTIAHKFTSYPLPASFTGPVGSNTLVIDRQGRVFGASGQDVIELDSKTKTFKFHPIPYYQRTGKSAVGYGMAISGDGMVWFAERNPSLIGRLDPATGKIREFQTPIPGSIPRRMGTGPAGNIWVALHQSGKLMKIDFETDKMTIYTPPTESNGAYSVVSDRDGMLWMSEQGADRIAMFNPKTNVFTEYPLPSAESDPRRIETDPSNPNRIWWSGDVPDRVGYIQIQR